MPSRPAGKKSRKLRLIFGALGILVAVPVVAVGVLLATFDADTYRPEIAALLSDKLGRKVALNGAMRLSLAQGLSLEINDAALANPAWGSRPDMAKIGKLSLALKLRPLLQRKLDVEQILVQNADIQLESRGGQKNWEFANLKQKARQPQAPKDQPEQESASAPIDLNINEFKLANVRLAMLDRDKNTTTEAKIDSLSLQADDKTALEAEGAFNGQDFSVTLEGANWRDILAGKEWPFTVVADFADNDFTGSGKMQSMGTKVEFSSFRLKSAIGSTADGNLRIALLGKPRIDGAVHIDKFSPPANSEKPAAAPQNAAPAAAAGGEPGRAHLFSGAPIDFSGLKAANASLQLTIDSIEAGGMKLDNLQTTLRLSNGRLDMQPITANLAGSPLNARLQLDASAAQPTLKMVLTGQNMDINPLLEGAEIPGASTGPANIALDVSSHGQSVRGFAENLNGMGRFELANGVLPLTAFKFAANNLLQAFLPGADKADDLKLTCGSARFTAKDGIITSDGILFDSNLAAIAGMGAVDLRQEKLDFAFKPRPKDAALEPLAPTMRVAGDLTAPNAKISAANTAVNIAGTLLGAQLPIGDSGLRVPMVDHGVVGNACSAALDNPTYAAASMAPATTPAGKLVEKGREVVRGKSKGLVEKLDKALGGENSPLKKLLGQ